MVIKIENNKCGDCTLCCDLFPVKWLNKPVNTKCIHCDLGCKIQDTKEDECRNFDCEYILDNSMGIELKPNNCDVLFEKVTTRIYLAVPNSTNPFAYQSDTVMNHIKKLNEEGITVVVSSFTDTPNEFFLAEGHDKDIVWKIAMREYEKIK